MNWKKMAFERRNFKNITVRSKSYNLIHIFHFEGKRDGWISHILCVKGEFSVDCRRLKICVQKFPDPAFYCNSKPQITLYLSSRPKSNFGSYIWPLSLHFNLENQIILTNKNSSNSFFRCLWVGWSWSNPHKSNPEEFKLYFDHSQPLKSISF